MTKQISPISALPNVTIVNVIASTKADRHLNIELLSTRLEGVDYTPEIFPGLIYRRSNPKATIIMFSTGKIVSIGSRSEKIARESIISTISEIERIEGVKIRVGKIATENIVAVSDIGYQIDVEKAINCGIKAIYEPEQFPGAIYRIRDNVTVLIFKSGKLISAGSKNENEARFAIYSTYEVLKKFGCIGKRKI